MEYGRRRIFLLMAGAVLALAASALPQAAGEQVTTRLVANLVGQGPDGKEQLVPADRVKPGDVLEYALIINNKGPGAIRELRPVLPIPSGTEYLPGTAKPAEIQASLDGRTYQPVPLKRTVKGVDGKPREEEVPYREYRFLAWHLGILAAEKDVTVKARVRVLSDLPVNAPGK